MTFRFELCGVSLTHISVDENSGVLLRIGCPKWLDVFIVECGNVFSNFGLLLEKVLDKVPGGDVNKTEDVLVAVF